ncbi:SGNH/GDSL hydrolase family protein [uncultured Gemmiger sp.]|uniref:SGNH/GDSL hydrolase family protein n=1 Tax=uncultured Gemmiger sp. TaxID=1623490 RepID=UPI0025F0C93D|nr:SGNH/GDSL hydrolase family protein [uncultured Gemmiger sp.]
MANRKPRAAKQQNFWRRMDARGRMFFVLALCSVALLITVAAAFVICLTAPGGAGGLLDPEAGDQSVVSGSDYDQNANSIDTSQYSGTVLPETEDAGQDYIDGTLFLGDSNTARMYRMFDYCSYANAIGSVGMSARQLEDYACVKFAGYSGYKTMPEAVALMQPERVIITFGTNDAGTDVDTFIQSYMAGIQAVQDAYPSVDVIVNSVPPIGRSHINSSLDQGQLDEYNSAIVRMCEENGWKFLNSAEALKGQDGYAKEGYTESDGIHLTRDGMDALFDYIRTHSYVTEDDRPALSSIPEHTGDKDVSVQTANSVTAPSSSSQTVATPAPESVAEPTPAPTPAPTQQPTATPQPSYTYWEEVIAPTCTESGYTAHHCNEDSSKDYIDNEVPALGHDPATQADGSVVCSRCGAVLQAAPTPAPSEQPAPQPPTDSGDGGGETTQGGGSSDGAGTGDDGPDSAGTGSAGNP